tara:strand:+ start:280 stop:540 length:261 start_codon:yes stop_codon:yes gene_type:complete
MPKFKVEILTKDYWIAEVEADDESEAEDVATEICQHELTSVSEKEKTPTLQYLDSDWDIEVIDNPNHVSYVLGRPYVLGRKYDNKS